MTKYSEKTATAVINSILKYTRKHETREALWYAWRDADGRQCVVDGFRAFRVFTPLAAVEEMPENFATPIDLERVYKQVGTGELHELEAPAPADLEALIAYDRQCSSRKRWLYMFGPGAPVVNVKYLRDALKVFPDARLYCRDALSGIILRSAHGDGVILPIRVQNVTDERREIIYNLSTFAARFAD